MIAVSTSPFNLSMLRKFNVWYSVKDGNFSDPTVWMSNGAKHHSYPQATDDVYISHNITFDVVVNFNGLLTIRNLFVSPVGKLLWSSGLNQAHFNVTNNVQCAGTLDFSGSTGGGGAFFAIGGVNNFINNFVTGNSTSSITVGYTSPMSFVIPNLPYYNLYVGGGLGNTKNISGDLNVVGTLTVDANTVFELGSFNTTVKDLSIIGTLSKNSSTGYFTVTNSTNSSVFGAAPLGTVNFSGSPTVNWSGNINSSSIGSVNFGTGTFNLFTNSTWGFFSGGNAPASIGACNFIIASGVTLTLNGAAAWLNKGTVNGVDGTSTLNVVTKYAYGNNNAVMATGVFNYNFSGTSTIYADNNAILTLQPISFYNLIINSGTTTLSGNTTITNNLSISGILQLSIYDFTVANITDMSGSLLKSGGGTVNFTTVNGTSGKIDFSLSNPTVNVSGNFLGNFSAGLNFGTTPINILQSINWGTFGNANTAVHTNSNYLIASGKTLINVGFPSATLGGINTTGTINGVDSTSIFDNRSVCNYYNSVAPMQTGQLYCNQAANTFEYGLAGNQDIQIPSDPTTPGYKNLTLDGSGAKRLLGNVSVKETYTLTSPATLNTNGFALTNP